LAAMGAPVSGTIVESKNFPEGLSVLVVDDDLLCLKVVEKMLKTCKYKVTACSNAESALKILRSKKNKIDIVLSDVHMPDMDGFKLLEIIQFELSIPVLMMSANSDSSVVLRGIIHGAVDYLLKPVRIEELRNIWQHIVRRDYTTKSPGSDEATTSSPNKRLKLSNSKSDEIDRSMNEAGSSSKRKKPAKKGGKTGKESEKREEGAEKKSAEGAGAKKPRVVWSPELHAQFVTAVNQLGIDKAVPKRILDLMGVQGLTRENVASHLQKYRLYLKRIQGTESNSRNGTNAARHASNDGMPQSRPKDVPEKSTKTRTEAFSADDTIFRGDDLSLPGDLLVGDEVGYDDPGFDPALLTPLDIDKVGKGDGLGATDQMLNFFLSGD